MIKNLSRNNICFANNFLDRLDDESSPDVDKIHIRVFQRNARHHMTTIEGLQGKHIKQFLSVCKKKLACGGCIESPNSSERLIKIFGDQRDNVKNLLVRDFSIKEDQLIIHGW